MKKFLQAAGVASLVLFGAAGCKTCCSDWGWTSNSTSCDNGQCPPGSVTTTSGHPGMVGTSTPTTMTIPPGGRTPMMPVNTMPATGAPVGTGSPTLHRQ